MTRLLLFAVLVAAQAGSIGVALAEPASKTKPCGLGISTRPRKATLPGAVRKKGWLGKPLRRRADCFPRESQFCCRISHGIAMAVGWRPSPFPMGEISPG